VTSPHPAGAAHHLVLRHRQHRRRDIENLHRRSDPPVSAGQAGAAPAARARLDDQGLIRPGSPRQARTRMAFLAALRPARPRPPCLPLAGLLPRLRRWAVLARGLGGVRGIPARLPAQRRHLGPQRLDQRGLLRHHRQQPRDPRHQLRIPGSQLLVQRLLRMRHPRTQP